MLSTSRQKRMEFTYNFIDELFRVSIGNNGDYSCALFDNDFSIDLEEAQRRKYDHAIQMLRLSEGNRVLDMGCGWGAFLEYVRAKGIEGIGVNLSTAQVNACVSSGLNVHLMDLMEVRPETFGKFDGVFCLGVSGHICSINEWKAGKQDEVYNQFFKNVSDLLVEGGRFYMDTLLFANDKVVDYEKFDIKAPPNSDEFILALMEKQFPDSWCAYGVDQILKNSSPYFNVVERKNSKDDFLETIKRWNKIFKKPSIKKLRFYLSYLPKYLVNKEFRHWLSILKYSPHRECFERNLMDFYRWTFEVK